MQSVYLVSIESKNLEYINNSLTLDSKRSFNCVLEYEETRRGNPIENRIFPDWLPHYIQGALLKLAP